MKPMPHEQRRLQQYATLSLSLSPDIRPEVTKKRCADFTQNVVNTLRQKRLVKHWVLVLLEVDKAGK